MRAAFLASAAFLACYGWYHFVVLPATGGPTRYHGEGLRRGAYLALLASHVVLAAVNLPIVNRSVEWWFDRTLHQKSSLTDGNLEDLTLFTLVVGIVVWALFFVWAMIHRFRVGWLERELRVGDLDTAIAARRAEARR